MAAMKPLALILALIFPATILAADDYAVWQDKRYVLAYNPDGQPGTINNADIIDALAHAATAWSPCGVQVVFGGFTRQPFDQLDGANVIGWQAELPGLMALTMPQYLRRIMLDADIRLNHAQIRDRDTLRRVVTHEIGHALGLFDHVSELNSLMNEKAFLLQEIDTPSQADMALCRARYRW